MQLAYERDEKQPWYDGVFLAFKVILLLCCLWKRRKEELVSSSTRLLVCLPYWHAPPPLKPNLSLRIQLLFSGQPHILWIWWLLGIVSSKGSFDSLGVCGVWRVVGLFQKFLMLGCRCWKIVWCHGLSMEGDASWKHYTGGGGTGTRTSGSKHFILLWFEEKMVRGQLGPMTLSSYCSEGMRWCL